MALTDKNILITPNIGAASDPKIVFSGADASTAAQNITLTVYPTNGGTLSFDGSTGQLFSVTNSMSGTIFSANDVSGIPSIEVLDTGLVKIAQYSGNVILGSATDTGFAKLQVTGNIRVSAGTTNFIHIGQDTGATPYNSISLNGNTTDSGNMGMTGGGNSDTTLYINSTGNITFRTNSFGQTPLTLTSAGASILGNTALHAGNYSSYALPLSGGTLTGKLRINGDLWGPAGDYAALVIRGTYPSMIYRSTTDNKVWLLHHDGNFNWYGANDGNADSTAWTRLMYLQQDGVLSINNNTALHAGNYTSYSPTLTGGSASGTWGISVTGSAGSLSLSNGFTLTASASSYGQFSNWIYLPGPHGLYSGVNSAHFYPNDASAYGAWHISGTRGGWGGLSFAADNGAVQLMVAPSSNETGFHANNYGWQFRWTSGTLYCHKNTYGGGTAATVLDTSNYTSYAVGLSSNNTVLGVNYFNANQDTGSGSNPPLQAFGTNSGAMMSFHRGGYYAVNMGLDSDNVIRIGGWSASANRLQMDMSGNLTMAGNVTAYSDERLKKDWELLPADFVKNLALVKVGTFTRIDSNERQVGVSAQSLITLLPEAVQDDGEYLSVAYGNAALASAVELAKEVVSLNARIARLETLVSKLIEG